MITRGIGFLRHEWKRRTKPVKRRAKRAREQRDVTLLRLRAHPRLWKPEQPVANPNTLFSRRVLKDLRGHVQRAAQADEDLLLRLADTRIGGVRDWEYGMLLGTLRNFPSRAGWRALDVGSGNSTFPRYLVESGNVGHMTTLDLELAHERQSEENRRRDEAAGIERVEGSMLDLPFADGEFDLVTCVSAIEHLDGDPLVHKRDPLNTPGKLPYDEYVARTRTAMAEMGRVLAPGGLLFVTSDAYVAGRQATDSWSSPRGEGPIWSAYEIQDIPRVFLEPLEAAALELLGTPDFAAEQLIEGSDRSTYRGRYFTTFAVAAVRGDG